MKMVDSSEQSNPEWRVPAPKYLSSSVWKYFKFYTVHTALAHRLGTTALRDEFEEFVKIQQHKYSKEVSETVELSNKFLCFNFRQNRWTKRGLAIVPTKFGISFTAVFLNQV